MKITAPAAALRDVLAAPKAVCSPNTHHVAHTGVWLMAGPEGLSVTGTDGDVTVVARTTVEVERPGEALVPPRPLAGLLDGLGPKTVTLETSDSHLVVRVERGAPYRLRLIGATFPAPLDAASEPVKAGFSGVERAVAAVRAAAGPVPSGVQLHSGPGGLQFAATDGYRLHTAVLERAGFGEFTGVLSLGVLEQVARARVGEVAVDGNVVAFEGAKARISARLLSTSFPEISAVLTPSPEETRFVIPAAEVRSALSRLGALGSAAPVRVEVDGTSMTLSASDAEIGEGAEEVELPTAAANPVSFAVDRGFLADAAGAHGDAAVEMAWRAALAPVRLSSRGEGCSVVTVVMPVKL